MPPSIKFINQGEMKGKKMENILDFTAYAEKVHKEHFQKMREEKTSLAEKIINSWLEDDKPNRTLTSIIFNITKLPEIKQNMYVNQVAYKIKADCVKKIEQAENKIKEEKEKLKNMNNNLLIANAIQLLAFLILLTYLLTKL